MCFRPPVQQSAGGAVRAAGPELPYRRANLMRISASVSLIDFPKGSATIPGFAVRGFASACSIVPLRLSGALS